MLDRISSRSGRSRHVVALQATAALYVVAVAISNLLIPVFIDLGAFGMLSAGTLPFGITFTLRDLAHQSSARAGLGRRPVFVMIGVAAIPLENPELALAEVEWCLENGLGAMWVPHRLAGERSPTHTDYYPVWSLLQDAKVPVVFHVGGTGDLIDPAYFQNGLPIPPDFHGGEENFRSVDYMAIPFPPMQTLATMLFDGVFDRFPRLRIGVIEQGAIWVPSWMRCCPASLPRR